MPSRTRSSSPPPASAASAILAGCGPGFTRWPTTNATAVGARRKRASVRRPVAEQNSATAADQEPEVRGAIAEVDKQVADLLCGPRPVRVRGHAEDVYVTGADLDHEQAVQALEGYRAVDVEEIGGEHCRGLGVQELPATWCR